MAALEGAEACLAASKAMSAILLLGVALLKAADHVIRSRSMCASPIMLFGRECAKFGVETTSVSQMHPDELRQAVEPNARLLFAQAPGDLTGKICHIRARLAIAKQVGAWLALDTVSAHRRCNALSSTAPTSAITRGPNISTGWFASWPRAICVIEHLVNKRFGPLMRCAGRPVPPCAAWVVRRGSETLPIRMRARSEPGQAPAASLQAQPQHALAIGQRSGSGRAVVSCVVTGHGAGGSALALDSNFHVYDGTQLSFSASYLVATKTTITHAGSTLRRWFSTAHRQARGIARGMICAAMVPGDFHETEADLQRGLSTLPP